MSAGWVVISNLLFPSVPVQASTLQVLDIVTQVRAGLPITAPKFARALDSGEPVFVDGWDAAREALSTATNYGAAAFLPVSVEEARRFVTAGTREARAWSAREQGVIRAVVRGLGLALERADQARQLGASSALLASANEELEAFAYSVSHELRTPVRHVPGFTDLARRALVKIQPDVATRHLEVIRQAGERMTALIDGMRMLSRVGQDDLRPQWAEVGALVTQAQHDVEAEFAGRPIHWHFGALPRVWGSPELLQQVMTHLLSNAVKYSAGRKRAEVTIGVEERPQE